MAKEMSDADLIRRLEDCPEDEKKEVFLTLYDRYKNLVLKVAYHYVKDYDRASDLTHDVFVRVIQSVQRLKDPDLFKSWLMTITRNLCVDSLRKTSYLSGAELLDARVEISGSERVEDALIAGMDHSKILELLKDCIQRLEEFDLTVFKLRWQGMRAAQVCKVLAVDKPQVRRSYDKIKRVLETCMQRKGLQISIDQMISLGEIDHEE